MTKGALGLPPANYSKRTFQEALVECGPKLFPKDQKRKWIKVHAVRTYANQWQDKLRRYLQDEWGEVWVIALPVDSVELPETEYVTFYVCPYTPELLLFYTHATSYEYERTLAKLVRERPGLGRMWIGPKVFEDLVEHHMDTFDPVMEFFIAERLSHDAFPSRKRPAYNRHIQWRAKDASVTLGELREEYGVRPTTVTLSLSKGSITMKNEGIFVITRVNNDMFKALDEALMFLNDEEQLLTSASQRVEFKTEKVSREKGDLFVPKIVSASIQLSEGRLHSTLVQQFMEKNDRFSFVGSRDKEGSFSWVTTVVDRDKRSMFGLNSNEALIRIAPQHNVTFESLLDFYQMVQEEIDPSAKFAVSTNESAK